MDVTSAAKGQAYNPNWGSDARVDVPEQNLTADVLDRVNHSHSIATEVRSRLYGLRDRIFGPQPSPPSAVATEKEAHCFSDVVRQRQNSLRDVLNDIDALSSEIANRL